MRVVIVVVGLLMVLAIAGDNSLVLFYALIALMIWGLIQKVRDTTRRSAGSPSRPPAPSVAENAPLKRPSRHIPQDVKIAVSVRDSGKCRICGSTKGLQYDHIIPWSRGGSSIDPDNIQLLCGYHNRLKRDL